MLEPETGGRSPKTFVTIKWTRGKVAPGYLRRGGAETSYDYRHVNAINGMLQDVYGDNFRLICITDNSEGFDADVQVFKINERNQNFIEIIGGRFFKLFLYSPEFANFVDSDFVYIDLDVSITGDIWYYGDSEIVILSGMGSKKQGRVSTFASLKRAVKQLMLGDIDEALNILRKRKELWCKYNSSYVFLRRGSCQDLWNLFTKGDADQILGQSEIVGTDQAWLHFRSDARFATVGPDEGFYRMSELGRGQRLVNFVAFPGPEAGKPWNETLEDAADVLKIYRRHFRSEGRVAGS